MVESVNGGGQRLDRLLANPALKDVQFDEELRTFRIRGRVVPGLLKPLKNALWPTYKYDAANDAASKRFARKDDSIRRPSDGRKRGSRVHLQIETLTNYGTARIKKRSGRAGTVLIDGYTRKILQALKAYALRPVMSELSLCDPELGVATKADLICLDARNRITLVEVKTGYYASWDRACGLMRGPTKKPLSDSPRNQALIQLLFTKRMIERTYGTRVDRAVVLRVDPDGVTPYTLPSDIEASGNALAAYVGEKLRAKRAKGKGRARL
jgi:hypothetical protein